MAIEILHFGGFLDGDEILDPAQVTSYVGGSAAQTGAAGLKLPTNVDNIMGIFKNNRSEDVGHGPQVNDSTSGTGVDVSVTYISGGNKVRMLQGPVDAAAPFIFPPNGGGGVWTAGDQIFWNIAAGKWDNQAEAGGDQSFGRVTKAPATAVDDLHAILFPFMPRTM